MKTTVVAGRVTRSLIALVVMAVLAIAGFSYYRHYRTEQAKLESGKKMKELALAMQGYSHFNGGKLPPAAIYGKDGTPES
jgi:hypothetical protein